MFVVERGFQRLVLAGFALLYTQLSLILWFLKDFIGKATFRQQVHTIRIAKLLNDPDVGKLEEEAKMIGHYLPGATMGFIRRMQLDFIIWGAAVLCVLDSLLR